MTYGSLISFFVLKPWYQESVIGDKRKFRNQSNWFELHLDFNCQFSQNLRFVSSGYQHTNSSNFGIASLIKCWTFEILTSQGAGTRTRFISLNKKIQEGTLRECNSLILLYTYTLTSTTVKSVCIMMYTGFRVMKVSYCFMLYLFNTIPECERP